MMLLSPAWWVDLSRNKHPSHHDDSIDHIVHFFQDNNGTTTTTATVLVSRVRVRLAK
jgi:hypothetical protein